MYNVKSENNKEKTIMVDKDCCVGCEECVYVCPTDAIFMADLFACGHAQAGKKAVINLERCNLCGACISECPVKAIKIV